MAQTPIANKYHEGKMQRTLKRESKVPEIVEGEPVVTPVSRDRITVIASEARLPMGAYGYSSRWLN